MEDLTKTQIILLLILVSVVTSFSTAIVTATLAEQSPSGSVSQTIQKVIERTVSDVTGKNASDTATEGDQQQRVISTVKNVSPAVVSIVASKDLPILEQCASAPFDNFFPDFQIPQLCQKGKERRQVSAGSGFIVRDDGLIVTNRHVVEDKEAQYTVIMNNGKKFDAQVLARDPVEDVAVVKINGKFLPHLTLGGSSNLEAGQTVIAIGNALGEFQNTVSVGVISGLHRTVVASGEELHSVIQTDAAINPGNSGGPLLSLDGKVIGVNTAIAAGAENIGFALPIDIIKKDIDAIQKSGRITYPFLGVRYTMIDEGLKQSKNLPVDEGALVIADRGGEAVTPDSPAATIGLKDGDIITKLGGEAVTREHTLAELIGKHAIGDTISLTYLRGGEEHTVQLVLIERKI